MTHLSPTSRCGRYVLLCLLPLLMHCQRPAKPVADATMPKPRELTQGEKDELVKQIADRFKQPVPAEGQFRAAGPFRFVDSGKFVYVDRTDLGSVAFDMSSYGVTQTALDPGAIARDSLLPRLEAGFAKTNLQAAGRQFEVFNDEFAGAVRPRGLPVDFDPRKASLHVARTAIFGRTHQGVSVFGSELMIGLMPGDVVGRFRLHWPKIEPSVVTSARDLQNAVRDKKWQLPQIMRTDDLTILDTSAGIGHSGFADPGFRSGAVVRVLYRKSSKDREYPVSSTGYKYFDANGREVQFSTFPAVPGTALENKPRQQAQ